MNSLEVFRRLKFLQMPQYTFEQPKEIFNHRAIFLAIFATPTIHVL